jgi:dTDP-4-dehydrorhamnose 3,5-epimerase
MIEVTKTELEGVLTIKPSVFEDHRGQYIETYNEKLYIDNGIEVKFVQDDISVSTKGVLRGLHGDDETWKLISCLYGEFYFIVLDYNEKSKNYGKWLYFSWPIDSPILSKRDQ